MAMNAIITKPDVDPYGFSDTLLRRLAREIAMDIKTPEEVVSALGLSKEWEAIQQNDVFQAYLRKSIEEWEAAGNTAERVRLKSLAFVEEALSEFYARAHDPKENLAYKTEVLKLVARLAGLGGTQVDGNVSGERLTVNINLGTDHNLRIERDVTPKVIEGDRL